LVSNVGSVIGLKRLSMYSCIVCCPRQVPFPVEFPVVEFPVVEFPVGAGVPMGPAVPLLKPLGANVPLMIMEGSGVAPFGAVVVGLLVALTGGVVEGNVGANVEGGVVGANVGGIVTGGSVGGGDVGACVGGIVGARVGGSVGGSVSIGFGLDAGRGVGRGVGRMLCGLPRNRAASNCAIRTSLSHIASKLPSSSKTASTAVSTFFFPMVAPAFCRANKLSSGNPPIAEAAVMRAACRAILMALIFFFKPMVVGGSVIVAGVARRVYHWKESSFFTLYGTVSNDLTKLIATEYANFVHAIYSTHCRLQARDS